MGASSWEGDSYWPGWASFWLFAIVIASHFLIKKFHFSLGLFALWDMLRSWSNVSLRTSVYLDLPPSLRPSVSAISFDHLFTVMSGIFLCVFAKRRHLAGVFVSLYAFAFLHTIVLAIELFLQIPGSDKGGFLGNHSMGSTFTACFLPIALLALLRGSRLWLHFAYMALAGWVIMASGSSQALLTLGASVFIVLAHFLWSRPKWLFTASIAAGLGVLAGVIFHESGFSNARFDGWVIFLQFWGDNFNRFVGSGPGTFAIFGPISQDLSRFYVGRWWLWAHNDWLQLMLESGFIGSILFLVLYLSALLKSFRGRNLEVLALLIAFGLSGICQYPTKIAISSISSWAVLLCAFRGVYFREVILWRALPLRVFKRQ